VTGLTVAVTGVGVVSPAVVGDSAALGAFLAAGRPAPGLEPGRRARLAPEALSGLVDPAEARRLSRVSQVTVAAARLARGESGLDPGRGLGLVVGTELGDLASTRAFADGFLERGPAGLSALLFPNTVMNTMAAATAITVGAREAVLTLNAPVVAGDLAVARAAFAVAAGRLPAALAGGVDELDPLVERVLDRLGFAGEWLGEGGAFIALEPLPAAEARGARVLGRITGAAWRSLPARPWGVSRRCRSAAIPAALEAAGARPGDIGWVYASASGDPARDAWEQRVRESVLDPGVAVGVPARLLGRHAGLGPLRVAAAAWTARSGRLPSAAPAGGLRPVGRGRGLVHALARGGIEVALVVEAP
jgi:3-oxoacyl-[acyl-carrier-protein] synthase II